MFLARFGCTSQLMTPIAASNSATCGLSCRRTSFCCTATNCSLEWFKDKSGKIIILRFRMSWPAFKDYIFDYVCIMYAKQCASTHIKKLGARTMPRNNFAFLCPGTNRLPKSTDRRLEASPITQQHAKNCSGVAH